MSYSVKLEGALALIQESNSTLHPEYNPKEPKSGIYSKLNNGELPEGYIDPEKFAQCIKFKARNEEILRGLKWEHILECLPVAFGVKPDSLARDISKIFRDGQGESLPQSKRPIIGRRAELLSARELIEAFDVFEPVSAVGKRLRDISKGKAFLVYINDQIIDVNTSERLLNELKAGHDARKDIEVNGEIKDIFCVGDIPDNEVDEDPLYTGRALRPDGTSDQLGRSWNGVPIDARQLIHLAVKYGEINVNVPNGHILANDILSVALNKNSFQELKNRFGLPASRAGFAKLAKEGQLPRLKIKLKQSSSRSKGPFENGKNVSEKWHQIPKN